MSNNTYFCNKCNKAFDGEGMAWECPECQAPAKYIIFMASDIPEVL